MVRAEQPHDGPLLDTALALRLVRGRVSGKQAPTTQEVDLALQGDCKRSETCFAQYQRSQYQRRQQMTLEAVDEFLSSVEGATMAGCGAFADVVDLDATVPNWRFSVHGGEQVKSEFGRWYADPGHFEELRRLPLPGGELVEFTLCWEENGIPHACHQVHVLGLDNGKIVVDRAWCGGRWPASLLAEMGESAGTGC